MANSSSSTTFSDTGTLPSGVSLTPAGLLSGTPDPGTGGKYPINVTASDGLVTDTTQAFTLVVEGPPVITSPDSATLTVGEPGLFLVTSAGVPIPALSEIGTLPAGVTFTDKNDGTATLAGTPGPGTDGVYSIATVAINGTNPPAITTLTLTVVQEPSVTSGEQAGFTLGQPGSFTVTTTGYPAAALRMNGALPDGLVFTDNGDGTATISGTPRHLTGSPVALSVQATNAAGSVTSPLAVTVSSGKAWLAGSDGAVYPVGTATSFGSMQAYKLDNPVVGLAATPDGGGYWLVASDGGVFNYGDAAFNGSGATGGSGSLIAPVVGITSSADGRGYSLTTSSGDVIPFGDGVAGGGLDGVPDPIVGISSP